MKLLVTASCVRNCFRHGTRQGAGWMRRGSSALLLSMLGLVWSPSQLLALDSATDFLKNAGQVAISSDSGFRAGSLIATPIPFSNDAVGSGAAVGAGYLFNFPGSKTSGLGLGYVRTSNGSNGYAFGGSFSFLNDRWTISAFAADGQVNYELPLGILGDVPLAQTVSGATAKVDYGISRTLKVGVGLSYLDSDIRLNSSGIGALPPILQPDLDVELKKMSFDIIYDTRDDNFFPRRGRYASLVLSFGDIQDSIFGGAIRFDDRRYTKIVGTYSGFRPVGETDVFAFRTVLCGSQEEAPFFDGCGVGFADGLRGFETLGSLSDWSASAQVEYRGRFNERFGYSLFAGAGAGGDGISSLSFDSGGAAAGIGLRYRISKRFGLDYRIDYARNDSGDGFLYFSVGQSF